MDLALSSRVHGIRAAAPLRATTLLLCVFALLESVRLPYDDWYLFVKVFGWLLGGTFLIESIRHPIRPTGEIYAYGGFLLTCALSAFPPLDADWFTTTITTTVQVFVLFLVASSACRSENAVRLCLSMAGIGIAVVVWQAFQEGAITEALTEGARATPEHINANGFGRMLVTATAILMYWFMRQNTQWRRAAILGLMAGAAVLTVLSGSRFSLSGLVLLYGGWLGWVYRRELMRRPAVVVMIVIAALWLGTSFFALTSDLAMGARMGEVREAGGVMGAESLAPRLWLYEVAMKTLQEHPVAGLGFGSVREVTEGWPGHSDFVEVAIQGGLIGLAFYYGVFLMVLRRLERARRRAGDLLQKRNAALLEVLIVVTAFLALGAPIYTGKLPWILIGCASGYATFLLETNGVKKTIPRTA